MAELTQKERLQPSLLDRLTDEAPDKDQEARAKRVMSVQQLRQAVLRDMAWLLNSVNLETAEDLDAYPRVAESVLNYGVPDLAGRTSSGLNRIAMERALRQAIIRFEPRLSPKTLSVRLESNEDQMNHNAVTLEIEGELWSQPIPLRLFLRGEVDLELGNVTVSEYG